MLSAGVRRIKRPVYVAEFTRRCDCLRPGKYLVQVRPFRTKKRIRILSKMICLNADHMKLYGASTRAFTCAIQSGWVSWYWTTLLKLKPVVVLTSTLQSTYQSRRRIFATSRRDNGVLTHFQCIYEIVLYSTCCICCGDALTYSKRALTHKPVANCFSVNYWHP